LFFPDHPKNNRRGQIFPVLILVLVAFVAAVKITKMAGEGAKANTFAANSADASSMAMASFQAGAFNKLVDRNKADATVLGVDNFGQYMKPEDPYWYYKRMRFFYEYMKSKYLTMRNQGNKYLTDLPANNAQYYVNEAIKELLAARTEFAKTINNCKKAPGMEAGVEAYNLLKEAQLCIAAYHVCAYYMYWITDWFKNYQTANFCEAKEFMQGPQASGGYTPGATYYVGNLGGAYKKSVEAGQSYGFNNSAIMSMLPEGLGDDFSFKLGTGALFGTDNAKLTSTYSWGDKGACFVSVQVDLPNITFYNLKPANWNWPIKHVYNPVMFPCIYGAGPPAPVKENVIPFDITASNVLYNQLQNILDYIKSDIYSLGLEIYKATEAGETCCNNCDKDPFAPLDCKDQCIKDYFDPARDAQIILLERVDCITNGLSKIANSSNGNEDLGVLSIPILKRRNDEYNWNNLWVKFNPIEPIKDCLAAKLYPDGETDFLGMMIVEIDNVTLDKEWKAKSTSTASCAGSSSVKVSTSKFWGDGGGRGQNIGEPGGYNDDYYPEILEAN